jgi:hypothetical protein
MEKKNMNSRIKRLVKKFIPEAAKKTLLNFYPIQLWRSRRFQAFRHKPNVYNFRKPERLGVVYLAPSDMPIDDRLFLYSFIRGVKPHRALEIGVLRGGSAWIITSAMEDNRIGKLVGIDPNPQIEVTDNDCFGRYRIIRGSSPGVIALAVEKLGGKLDVVFLDGLHIFTQASADLTGVLPFMAKNGYILVHDSFHYGVYCAVEKFLLENPSLVDCGLLSVSPQLHADPQMPYGVIRVLRVSSGDPYVLERIKNAYTQEGLVSPIFDKDVLDHDGWYCNNVKACAKCRKEKEVKQEK